MCVCVYVYVCMSVRVCARSFVYLGTSLPWKIPVLQDTRLGTCEGLWQMFPDVSRCLGVRTCTGGTLVHTYIHTYMHACMQAYRRWVKIQFCSVVYYSIVSFSTVQLTCCPRAELPTTSPPSKPPSCPYPSWCGYVSACVSA